MTGLPDLDWYEKTLAVLTALIVPVALLWSRIRDALPASRRQHDATQQMLTRVLDEGHEREERLRHVETVVAEMRGEMRGQTRAISALERSLSAFEAVMLGRTRPHDNDPR